jgi:hypothetical protein
MYACSVPVPGTYRSSYRTGIYSTVVLRNLLKNGKILRSKLIQVLDKANEPPESLEDVMSEDEYSFVKESLNSKVIPPPKLLIKDHKEINEDRNYPTRLVPVLGETEVTPRESLRGLVLN